MTEPTTPTGKRLWPLLDERYRDSEQTRRERANILAIEAEAAAAERERLLRKHRTHVHHDLPPRLVRSYGDWLLDNGGGDPCPGTSSVTGAACLLEDGHTEYKADRFHMFADPEPRPMRLCRRL